MKDPMKDLAGNRDVRRLRAEVDVELERVASSMDPVGDDEPEADQYATRLHSLRDATSAMAAYEDDQDDT